MKLFTSGVSIAACSLFVGCAAVPDVKPADYQELPGSGDHMAKGPGLFEIGDKSDYEDGLRVYSNDPSHGALINPHRAQAQTPSASTATAPTDQPMTAQQQDYREFQEYVQYKHFQQRPKDSAEYQRFKDWQEWKQYKQWRSSGNANP